MFNVRHSAPMVSLQVVGNGVRVPIPPQTAGMLRPGAVGIPSIIREVAVPATSLALRGVRVATTYRARAVPLELLLWAHLYRTSDGSHRLSGARSQASISDSALVAPLQSASPPA